MGKTKIFVLIILFVTVSVILTGCNSDLGNYCLRENVGKAAINYMEEKYGVNFTKVKEYTDSQFVFFWNDNSWYVTMTCEELPGCEIMVNAMVNEDKKSYTFYDNYQSYYHLAELKNIINSEVDYFFDKDVIVDVSLKAGNNNEDFSMMNLSEFTQTVENNYFIYVVCTGGAKEEAIEKASEFSSKIESDYNIFCSWFLCSLDEGNENINEIMYDENGDIKLTLLNHCIAQKNYKDEWKVYLP